MSGATVQRGNRETEKETEEFRFPVCSLSCEPHKAQTAAGSRVPSESCSYQGRKLHFASWASGVFWRHLAGSASSPISIPSFTSHQRQELTGQERGDAGSPSSSPAPGTKCKARKASASLTGKERSHTAEG